MCMHDKTTSPEKQEKYSVSLIRLYSYQYHSSILEWWKEINQKHNIIFKCLMVVVFF